MPESVLTIDRVATASCPPTLLAEIRGLLDRAFHRFDDHHWDHALGGTHVLARLDGVVVGHAAVVERTLEIDGVPVRAGYVEAVATEPAMVGRGIAATVMADVDDLIVSESELGGLCTGLDGFYERFGWERWLGPTSVRRTTGIERSPAQDGLVFVLRHGPSTALDLGAPISCDERPGDDW